MPGGKGPTPPGDVGHGAAVVLRGAGNLRGPGRIAQSHLALPSVLAAAEPRPAEGGTGCGVARREHVRRALPGAAGGDPVGVRRAGGE